MRTMRYAVCVILCLGMIGSAWAQSSDMNVSILAAPSPACANTSQLITVRTTNAGPDDALNYVLSVTIDGTHVLGSPITIGSLLNGTFRDDNFIYTFPKAGRHPLVVTVSPGTPADPNMTNNVAAQSIDVLFNGTFTVGADLADHFSTIKMAVDTLNTYGLCGSTTIQVDAGHTETNANIALNATGTAVNTLTFVAAGTPHPVVQSSPAGSGSIGTSSFGGSGDAIIKINGSDYVTFDGIDVQEMYTGTTATLRVEYGYMVNRASITDGAKHVTIKNCNITMNRKCLYSCGIYQSNMNGSGAGNNPSSAGGIHEFNSFQSNNISNVYVGVQLRGFNDGSPFDFYDHSTDVGVGGGNVITNYGGANGTAYGIYAIYQDNVVIANDSINGGDSTSTTLYGIFTSTGTNSSVDIYNNKVTIRGFGTNNTIYGISNMMGGTGTSNTVNIYDNKVHSFTYTSATSGQTYGIYNNTSPVNLNIYDNDVYNISTPGSGAITGIDGGSANTINIYGNHVFGLEKTGAASIYGIRAASSTLSIQNNEVNDIYCSSGTVTLYGIYCNTNTNNEEFYENSVYDLRHDGTGNIYGMYLNSASSQRICRDNNLYGYAGGDCFVMGIYTAGAPAHVFRNKIYDLESATSGTTKYVSGITHGSANKVFIYNNLISDLRAEFSTGNIGIRGINLYSNTVTDTVGVYYNTVYLDAASSAAIFGSTCLYSSTNSNLDLRNNILVNLSDVNGTAYNSAFYRSNWVLTTYLETSNNNCFYAGTPSPKNVIYSDGTNSDLTISDFRTRVSPNDSNSFTELPPFVNIVTPPYDLHLLTTEPTKCESGGLQISAPIAITEDHDLEVRHGETGYSGAGIATDVGADENDLAPRYNDLGLYQFYQPTQHHCYTNHETISVALVNMGMNDINFASTPVTVSATADDGSAIQSFDTTINSGTLSPMMVMGISVTITSALDLHIPGTYQIDASHNWGGDQYGSNDHIQMQIISNNPEITGISAPTSTICQWDSVPLTATVFGYGGGALTLGYSRDTVSPIPDPGTISSEIVVSGAGGMANELVAVTIDSLMHNAVGDIDLFLQAPNGSIVELSSDNGGISANYLHTVFRMDAVTPINTGAAPFTGNYLPEYDFAGLTGNANGTWKLIVTDDNASVNGSLFKWSLTLKNPNSITSYNWTPTAGLYPVNSATPQAAPDVSTTYVLTVTDELGCISDPDSISILVNPSHRDTVDHEVCDGDSLFAEGAWQFTSGYYTDMDVTLLGCDSITVWNLIVHPVYNDTINFDICSGDSLYAAGAWQTSGGLYYDHFFSIFGCDSVVYSDLTVFPSYHDTIYPQICQGDSIFLSGSWQFNSGVFVDSYNTIQGCDSITWSYLTVNPLPVIDLGIDTTLCWEFPITLDAGNPGATFLWSNGDFNQTSLIDSSRYWLGSHTIWVQVDDGCVNTDTIIVSFSPCTGIQEDCLTKLVIFPNPTDGLVRISGDSGFEDYQVTVLSTEGKMILRSRISDLRSSGNAFEVDLSQQAPGIYMLDISNGKVHKSFPVVRK